MAATDPNSTVGKSINRQSDIGYFQRSIPLGKCNKGHNRLFFFFDQGAAAHRRRPRVVRVPPISNVKATSHKRGQHPP